ncbi:transcriptional regulator domain-containing protein [Paracoccus denitrificans]|uniref:transcriptional regulator domain-containing protein n=1 Tax=Paracoccus denitrificans TaxID=266 RepID=UPI0039BF7023
MLSGIDWRASVAYRHAKTIPAAGFAWEYLRRDDEYHQDFRAISRMRNPTGPRLDAFARRWGLRFPLRS